MNIDRIKEKIRKMIALSQDDGAAPGEIENAIDAATRLMAANNLTREDIDHSVSGADAVKRVELGRCFAYSYATTLTSWEKFLGAWAAKFVGYCSTYNEPKVQVRKGGIMMRDYKGDPLVKGSICFYGSNESCAAAVELFEEVRDTIVAMAILRYNGHAKGNGAAYCYGFQQGLSEQLSGAELRLDTGAESHALILVDKQNQLAVVERAEVWLNKKHGIKLSRGSGFGGYNDTAGARQEGREDGKNYSASSRAPVGRRIGGAS